MSESPAHTAKITEEFGRAASGFASRTKGRFDDMDVVAFARHEPSESVLEVGAGTGNFLALFESASALVALDLTHEMLVQGRRHHDDLLPVRGEASRLPFGSGSFDLVASAQMLHHVWRPVPLLMEMRRVAGKTGRVLIVDQYATESYEEQAFMNQLEVVRDPSHAVSRALSTFKVVLQSAGLKIVDQRVWTGSNRLSDWMWPGEFPQARIDAVTDLIERFGGETGMEWRRVGDDWEFTRRRVMILAGSA